MHYGGVCVKGNGFYLLNQQSIIDAWVVLLQEWEVESTGDSP